jgi:hypothetical protein
MSNDPSQKTQVNSNHGDRSLLASVRRAIDDNCRGQRRDVLIDAAIVLVARRGKATTRVVLQDLRMLFRTDAIPLALAQQALDGAFVADLVTKVQRLGDEFEWSLTDSARRDVSDDEQWANGIIGGFDKAAAARLVEDADFEQVATHRVPILAATVRQALAIGCQGLYEVQPATTPDTVRPIAFNEQAAIKHMQSVEPKSVRHALERLLLAALNPDDSFGDEYIHLLVAGNVLHAMATRRDLPNRPNLSGARVVLDTSALVDLASPGTPEAQEVEEAIRLSVTLGVLVVVPQHVIDEWVALFNAADAEIADSAVTVERFGLLGVLADNTFLRAFNADSSGNAHYTWAAFRAKWQDPSNALTAMGVTIRPHFNDNDVADSALVEELAKELRILNRQREDRGRKMKKSAAILADANSLAMVARWRGRLGPDSAYFIARDTMSSSAYAKVRAGDLIPVAVSLPAWLVFVASLTVDDPQSKSEIAQVIGNAALRNSFFGLCSCYTYKEIVEFAEALREDKVEVEAADITAFVQQKLASFEAESATTATSPAKEGARVLRHRSLQRSQRARRSDGLRETELHEAVSRERQSAEVAGLVRETKHKDELDHLSSKVTDVSGELARQKQANRLLIRLLVSVAVTAGMIVTTVVLWRAAGLSTAWKARLLVGGGLWLVLSGWWVKAGSKNVLAYALGGLVAPTLLSILLGIR